MIALESQVNLAGPPAAWPIYKYQPITTLRSAIFLNESSGPPPSAFNDPFECRLQRADSPQRLEQLRLDNPQLSHLKDEAFVALAIAQFEQQFAKWGIVCFSHRADDIMMWSHYAYHHRGDGRAARQALRHASEPALCASAVRLSMYFQNSGWA